MTVGLGTATNLAVGRLVCTLPAKVGFWFVQCQDAADLTVTFLGQGQGNITSIVLGAASAPGGYGGYLDSVAFPYFAEEGFLLTSSLATAQFGSGALEPLPVNSYPYPGNKRSPNA